MASDSTYDIFVIGGGIHGVGIARDAAGRGYKTMLCEMDDLGSGTSSKSSKLIHGGLRYLEHGHFRLVNEALAERAILLKAAPHIVWPLKFCLPTTSHTRSRWLIRFGLFLYDIMAGNGVFPPAIAIDMHKSAAGSVLDPSIATGFIYHDCWCQDYRMVIVNALDARDKGAEIFTRSRCTSAVREDDIWKIEVEKEDGSTFIVRSRALVNAAGPWAASIMKNVVESSIKPQLSLVRGSHIIVKRVGNTDYGYVFQNHDKRIIFMLPYEGDYTLIGTTEVVHDSSLSDVEISPAEIKYLCTAVSDYLMKPIMPSLVISSFAGVRPIYDSNAKNTSSASRDYTLQIEQPEGQAPLLSVLGGKLTTYRKLSENAVNKLGVIIGAKGKDWTEKALLPGGSIKGNNIDTHGVYMREKYPWLPVEVIYRYTKNYGSMSERILEGATSLADMGAHICAGLYAREIEYLIQKEWVQKPEDILWRRSKCGLRASPEEVKALEQYFETRRDLKAA